MTELEKRLEVLWKNQNPFVVYRLPKSKKIHIFFQNLEIIFPYGLHQILQILMFFALIYPQGKK